MKVRVLAQRAIQDSASDREDFIRPDLERSAL